MANNYTSFSVEFVLPIDKMEAVTKALQDDEDRLFQWEPASANSIIVYSEESGDPNNVVNTFQQLMNDLDFNVRLGFEWADTCSKPRPGEFGGGCVVFNSHHSQWMHTNQHLATLAEQLKETDNG